MKKASNNPVLTILAAGNPKRCPYCEKFRHLMQKTRLEAGKKAVVIQEAMKELNKRLVEIFELKDIILQNSSSLAGMVDSEVMLEARAANLKEIWMAQKLKPEPNHPPDEVISLSLLSAPLPKKFEELIGGPQTLDP